MVFPAHHTCADFLKEGCSIGNKTHGKMTEYSNLYRDPKVTHYYPLVGDIPIKNIFQKFDGLNHVWSSSSPLKTWPYHTFHRKKSSVAAGRLQLNDFGHIQMLHSTSFQGCSTCRGGEFITWTMGIKYDSMGFTKHCWCSNDTQWDIYHKSAIKRINMSLE